MILLLAFSLAHHHHAKAPPAPATIYIVPKPVSIQPGDIIIRSGPVWHGPEDYQSRDPFEWAKDNRSIA